VDFFIKKVDKSIGPRLAVIRDIIPNFGEIGFDARKQDDGRHLYSDHVEIRPTGKVPEAMPKTKWQGEKLSDIIRNAGTHLWYTRRSTEYFINRMTARKVPEQEIMATLRTPEDRQVSGGRTVYR
jgi:hypothetical protein